ncbi:hypothetical protein KV381_00190 [Streptomyces sp. WY228]|nr:hypothetical protein KV381_00190 [Streptomyces sp. WY228]
MGAPVRELQYLATAKLDDFYEPPRRGLGDRSLEAEASAMGISARIALGPSNAEQPTATERDAERLEKALAHLRETCSAHTQEPSTCQELGGRAWLEFCGPFLYGAAARDLGLRYHDVFTWKSLEEGRCRHRDDEFCGHIQLLLCGSMQHVRDHRDHPPSRMGSGSDWLHDLAVDLVAREARGDTSLPSLLGSTRLNDQEFAARSAFAMHADHRTAGYLRGHARVLCNFPPEPLRHRLIVATPLYVETGLQRPPSEVASAAPPTTGWLARWRRRRS